MLKILRFFNKNTLFTTWGSNSLFYLPLIHLVILYYYGSLGINPFEEIMSTTGFWGMIFLLLALGISPLRRWLAFCCKYFRFSYGKRLADWNFLIRQRQWLGICFFVYATAHFLAYLFFELDFDLTFFLEEVQFRRFILYGLVGWVLAAPLFLTSNSFSRKKLGKRWLGLHKLTYIVSILVVAHAYLEAKVGEYDAWYYVFFAALFLMHRIFVKLIKSLDRKDDTGEEITRRVK